MNYSSSPGFTKDERFQQAVKECFGKVRLVVLVINIDLGIQQGVSYKYLYNFLFNMVLRIHFRTFTGYFIAG